MAAKHWLLPVVIALTFLGQAHADTNTAGDELTISNETEATGAEVPAQAKGALQLTPLLSTPLPEIDTSAEINNSLWQRIKSGYAMPELDSPITATQESWYAARPDYVKRMMLRSQKYLFHIVEEVQKRGMPTEIALLPMVESAFNPQAYSTGHASGIWQFVPATGKNFGLKQTWWVDNRRDVTAATDAALTYLQKLHVMFGSWDLALAAYNAGEGTVMRAIESNRRKGLPTDYQSLSLPPETRSYVPKLQAVKNIVSNPGQYGLDIQPIANVPYFTQVTAPRQIDTKLAAKLAGVSLEEFVSLNPEYNRPVMTSSGNRHEILLPIGREDEFTANLANYTKPLVSWQTYNAKRGERLDSVARKFGVSVAQLRDVNDISAKSKIKNSGPLLVPSQSQPPPADLSALSMAATPQAEEKSDAGASAGRRHTVAKGDTLASIAKRNGVTAKQLMALNHLNSAKLKNGQTLLVQAPATAKPPTRTAKTESSAKQASKTAKAEAPAKQTSKTAKADISAKQASSAANAKASALQAIKTAKTRESSTKVAKAAKPKTSTTHYQVKRGDTLGGIAHRFEVDADDLLHWNNLSGNRLSPGDKLVIHKPNAA